MGCKNILRIKWLYKNLVVKWE